MTGVSGIQGEDWSINFTLRALLSVSVWCGGQGRGSMPHSLRTCVPFPQGTRAPLGGAKHAHTHTDTHTLTERDGENLPSGPTSSGGVFLHPFLNRGSFRQLDGGRRRAATPAITHKKMSDNSFLLHVQVGSILSLLLSLSQPLQLSIKTPLDTDTGHGYCCRY